MSQLREGVKLAFEQLDGASMIARAAPRQNTLQRDASLRNLVVRGENGGGPALAELRLDPVTRSHHAREFMDYAGCVFIGSAVDDRERHFPIVT
jgi:hypothetical protein